MSNNKVNIKEDLNTKKIVADVNITPVISVQEFTVRCDASMADKVKEAIEKALEEVYDADN